MTKAVVLVVFAGLWATAYSGSCGIATKIMRSNPPRDLSGQRIVGGVEARPGSHPWIVSIQRRGKHFCGGSLVPIANKDETDIVVTAAHCIYDGANDRLVSLNPMTVTAGAHDISKDASPRTGQQTVGIAIAAYNKSYNPDTSENDIAILKLDKPVRFNTAVQPICMPPIGERIRVGTELTVAGWGLTDEYDYMASNILMQVGVPVIDAAECAQALESQGVKINETIMICAGYKTGGKDACQGDSGGPIVRKKGGRYFLVGVVSFGIGCARENMPGVYTRISTFVDWIDIQIMTYSSLRGRIHRARL